MSDNSNELKQAERDRDMALIGDAVHLLAQGAAMHGGAWKIGKPTNFTEQANKRILEIKKQERERLQKQNAALIKQMQTETKQKQQQQQTETKQKQQQQQFDARQKQQQQQFDARLRQQRELFGQRQPQKTNGGSKKSAWGGGKDRTIEVWNAKGTKKIKYPNLVAAYRDLPDHYKLLKRINTRDGVIEFPISNPTNEQMLSQIELFNYDVELGMVEPPKQQTRTAEEIERFENNGYKSSDELPDVVAYDYDRADYDYYREVGDEEEERPKEEDFNYW